MISGLPLLALKSFRESYQFVSQGQDRPVRRVSGSMLARGQLPTGANDRTSPDDANTAVALFRNGRVNLGGRRGSSVPIFFAVEHG
jgi:hypothetical protein